MSLFNIISIRNYFSNNLEIVNTLKSIHTRDNSSILVAKTNPEHTINHSKNSIITSMNSNNLLISDSLINDLADHDAQGIPTKRGQDDSLELDELDGFGDAIAEIIKSESAQGCDHQWRLVKSS